ncbi:hypothetical protein [Sphingomonas sp.]
MGELFGWRYAFGAAAGLATIAIIALAVLLPKVAPHPQASCCDSQLMSII